MSTPLLYRSQHRKSYVDKQVSKVNINIGNQKRLLTKGEQPQSVIKEGSAEATASRMPTTIQDQLCCSLSPGGASGPLSFYAPLIQAGSLTLFVCRARSPPVHSLTKIVVLRGLNLKLQVLLVDKARAPRKPDHSSPHYYVILGQWHKQQRFSLQVHLERSATKGPVALRTGQPCPLSLTEPRLMKEHRNEP